MWLEIIVKNSSQGGVNKRFRTVGMMESSDVGNREDQLGLNIVDSKTDESKQFPEFQQAYAILRWLAAPPPEAVSGDDRRMQLD